MSAIVSVVPRGLAMLHGKNSSCLQYAWCPALPLIVVDICSSCFSPFHSFLYGIPPQFMFIVSVLPKGLTLGMDAHLTSCRAYGAILLPLLTSYLQPRLIFSFSSGIHSQFLFIVHVLSLGIGIYGCAISDRLRSV